MLGNLKKKELERIIRDIVKEEITKAFLKRDMENVQVNTNIATQPLDLNVLYPEKRKYDIWCKGDFFNGVE